MSTVELSFVEKRDLLQRQLRAQRQQLSQQWLAPSRAQHGYPRSLSMRFLATRPGLIGLIKSLVLLLVGARLYQSVQIILMMVRFVQLASLARQTYLPKK